jgi:hypothetical protein
MKLQMGAITTRRKLMASFYRNQEHDQAAVNWRRRTDHNLPNQDNDDIINNHIIN